MVIKSPLELYKNVYPKPYYHEWTCLPSLVTQVHLLLQGCEWYFQFLKEHSVNSEDLNWCLIRICMVCLFTRKRNLCLYGLLCSLVLPFPKKYGLAPTLFKLALLSTSTSHSVIVGTPSSPAMTFRSEHDKRVLSNKQ